MANDLDVGRLRLLREVGLRGSIAAAARELGLTPSAVSQQLAVLERETGAALLDRSPRGVVLTGAGELLAGRTGQVLELLACASAELDRLTGAVGGAVRIAAVASAAASIVSDAICALRRCAPAIEASVVAVEPDRGIALLLTGDVDLAVVDEYDFVPLALPDGAVVAELAVEPLVVVRPADARGARRRRTRLVELADQDWVMPPEDAACGRAVRAACRTAGFEPRVRWETDDMLLLVKAVAQGHGVAVLPERSVATDVAGVSDAAGVSVGGLHDPVPTRRLRSVARPSSAARPAVAEVLAALAAAAR